MRRDLPSRPERLLSGCSRCCCSWPSRQSQWRNTPWAALSSWSRGWPSARCWPPWCCPRGSPPCWRAGRCCWASASSHSSPAGPAGSRRTWAGSRRTWAGSRRTWAGSRRGVERDHLDALVTGLLDRGHDRLGVARGDEDALDPGGDHVLDGGRLAGVVAVELAGGGQQLGALGGRLLGGALLHLDEERVGLGLGDQPDLDLAALRRPR